MKNYELLFKKYKHKENDLIFTKEEVANILVSKFQAVEFSKLKVHDLVNDDQLEYTKIYKCFVIDNISILNKLFSDEEKKMHYEQIQDNKKYSYRTTNLNNETLEYNKLLLDEQEGRRIDIFLESKDGLFITEFIVRDQCEKVNRYLNALIVGALIKNNLAEYDADYNDYYFQFYLENLNRLGFFD